MNVLNASLEIRPLVVGAAGLAGRAVTDRLEELYPHTVSATRAELDITDRWRTEAELERLRPTVVVNCAAEADVDACERDPEAALRINGDGPRHLAEACRNGGVRLIHLSTDYVFDGEAGARGHEYDEADAPNPVNEYGRSKLLGEMAALETLADCAVVRVSFVFGPGRATFLDKVVAQARAGSEPLTVLDSWVNKPTHVAEIVRAIERLVAEGDVTGVLHLAGAPAVSRLAFAREVLRLIGDDPDRVRPLDPARLVLPARRPAATPLSTRRWEARFGPLRPWTDWARDYLRATGAIS
jgi:dTDP-4-dehydrorhamnose reductase